CGKPIRQRGVDKDHVGRIGVRDRQGVRDIARTGDAKLLISRQDFREAFAQETYVGQDEKARQPLRAPGGLRTMTAERSPWDPITYRTDREIVEHRRAPHDVVPPVAARARKLVQRKYANVTREGALASGTIAYRRSPTSSVCVSPKYCPVTLGVQQSRPER